MGVTIMWAAMIMYDEGRLGQIGIFGLESREEAIAWLWRGWLWDSCSYMKPSWRIDDISSQ